jgi:hypothetical protein
MKKIIEFWRHSWETDKVAFCFELVSFVFTVSASLVLAFNADNPDMRIVYPGFFVGSITAVIAYYRRKLAWPLLLTVYFAGVNILGFGVAMTWW